MKIAGLLNILFVSLIVVSLGGHALADGPGMDSSKVLAVVPVKSGKVDQAVYRQFDRLVPELKKLSKSRVVKLECRYSGNPERERDVDNAYKLAGRIEKYLRVRHKLDLDLWVAIDITPKTVKSSPVLTIAVFSDDIKKLDSVLIDPKKKEQQ